MTAKLHEQVELRLSAADQRYTPQRRALIELLATAEGPLTVPQIVERSVDLPQSSAYRSVHSLVEVGVLTRVASAGEHWRVELAEGVAGHHHHLICEECGVVADVPASPKIEAALRAGALALGEEYGFSLVDHRLDLVGRCERCNKRTLTRALLES